MDEYDSLSHSKWECKYHVVFIPKYRRKKLYKELRPHLGEVFKRLAEQKESHVVEGHLQSDHVHILLSIPPKYAVSQVVGFIKGKSAIHLARVYGERKQNFVGQHFWARGFLVSTVGRDEAVVREYIRNQEKEDQRLEQLKIWQGPATDKVAQSNRGRVSDPALAALSGSHRKAPGSAGGYLLCAATGSRITPHNATTVAWRPLHETERTWSCPAQYATAAIQVTERRE